MKFSLGAVIPVKTYGNLQPTLEVEAETFEEAAAQVTPFIEAMWAQYVDDGKPLRGTMQRQKLTAFVGGDIYFDPLTHTYTNEAGEVYLSGSQYAAQFEKPFDAQAIAGKMAEKHDIPASEIIAMWQLKSDVSTGFGTAVHAAMELYDRYGDVARALGKTTHLHDHPVIKQAVEKFYAAHTDEVTECEALIVDHKAKRAGRVDRLLLLPEINGKSADIFLNRCRIQDYKTNADITKHLPSYWKQLQFYGSIMEAGGWEVEGYDIFHWDGDWHTYSKNTEKEKEEKKEEQKP